VTRLHEYKTTLCWTGNLGTGTSHYTAYGRDHEVAGPGKASIIEGSSDKAFRGDGSRYNPEELLVASLSQCHLLWYLHLCAVNEVVVEAYEDAASGTMLEESDGSGQFTQVVLRPLVTVSYECDLERAKELHHEAGRLCFIARSVKFPVLHEPSVLRGARRD
jgi:organic hydroperoxide reductase OsmC/OhrA